MKVDLSVILTDLEGNPIKEQYVKDEKIDVRDMTLGRACVSALMYEERNAQGQPVPQSEEDKIKDYELAKDIIKGGEQDIDVSAVAHILKCSSKAHGKAIYGAVREHLNG